MSLGCAALGPDPRSAVDDLRAQVCREAADLGEYGRDVVAMCVAGDALEDLVEALELSRLAAERARAALGEVAP